MLTSDLRNVYVEAMLLEAPLKRLSGKSKESERDGDSLVDLEVGRHYTAVRSRVGVIACVLPIKHAHRENSLLKVISCPFVQIW